MVFQGPRIRKGLIRTPIRLDLEFTVGGKDDGCVFICCEEISFFISE